MAKAEPQAEGSTSESGWTESAFESVFLEYYSLIVGVLFRLLGERTRAEEVANDVFWKLYRQRGFPNPEGNLGGWLYRAASNLGIDALRAAARRQRYEDAAARARLGVSDPAGPLDEVLRKEKCRRVRTVLASLKPAQAQILILRASGLSYKELAAALGVKLGGVGTMLNRAEVKFQKRYRELYGDEEKS